MKYLRKTILVLILNCSIFSAQARTTLHLQEVIQQLGILQQDLVNLEQGKTVSFKVSENDEKELAAGVAIYIPSTPSKIVEFIKDRGMASVDTEVISQSVISPQATLDTFKKSGLKLDNKEEEELFSAKPGDKFNLSTQELKMLQTANPVQPGSVSQTYGKILFQRWQTYRKEGLQGIAAYDRGADSFSYPGRELRTATLNNKVLVNHFPELYQIWLNYPVALPIEVEERFFLINRQVENRPTAVLLHRIILAEDTGGIIISRQFYVGHSYNSSQLIIGCLPYRTGSLLFYTNRTFTDQVTGLGSSLKRSIGREQMRRRMDRHLISLSNALK